MLLSRAVPPKPAPNCAATALPDLGRADDTSLRMSVSKMVDWLLYSGRWRLPKVVRWMSEGLDDSSTKDAWMGQLGWTGMDSISD